MTKKPVDSRFAGDRFNLLAIARTLFAVRVVAMAMWIYAAIAVLQTAMTPLGIKGLPISPLILAAGLVALWAGARRPTSTS